MQLSRAGVQDLENEGGRKVAEYRISESAWLNTHEDPVLAKLDNRIEQVRFQVLYCIDWHHFDQATDFSGCFMASNDAIVNSLLRSRDH
jgi:hypothetical protein